MSEPSPDLDAQARAAVEELRTVADMVRWAASRLAESGAHLGHGSDDPVDEGMHLVLHAVGLRPGLPAELWAARLTREERRRAAGLVVRRIGERVPAAYLTRRAWFAGIELYVDERVLVPRSPLAEWIERGFEPFVDAHAVRRVLDVGTGSGCIAIACARAFEDAGVDAIDVSPDAIDVARINVEACGVADRVRLVRSDLFAEIDGRYDLIVANPPYVDAAAMAALPAEHRHEPAGALAAGVDGLDCVRRILAEAPAHLEPHGALVVEVGASRAAFERAYPDLPVAWLEFERGGEGAFLVEAGALVPGGR